MPEWVRFQKWVAREFRKIGYKANPRSQAGGGFGVPDVDADPFHVECKSYDASRPDIRKALLQAKIDSCGNPSKYAIAVTKYTDETPIASMYFKDFLNLLKEFKHE